MNRSMTPQNRKATALGYWHERAQQWLMAHEADQAYAHLLFAFGFTRCGEWNTALRLANQSNSFFHQATDDATRFLGQAFRFRVNASLRGSPHVGPLPTDLNRELSTLSAMDRYAVDRLRQASRVLEPEDLVSPFQAWIQSNQTEDIDTALHALALIDDGDDLWERIQTLRNTWKTSNPRRKSHIRLMSALLGLVPRLDWERGKTIFDEAGELLINLPEPQTERGYRLCSLLIQRAMQAVRHLGCAEPFDILWHAWSELMANPLSTPEEPTLPQTFTVCARTLRDLGRLEDLEHCADEMMDWLKQHPNSTSTNRLHQMLSLAEVWLMQGNCTQPAPVLDEVRDQLLYRRSEELKQDPRVCTRAICRYISALGYARLDLANERIEELLDQLEPPVSHYTTNRYYCLPALEIVESVATCLIDLQGPHCQIVSETEKI